MGDKVAARIAATSAGLPIIPGTDTAISTAAVRNSRALEGFKLRAVASKPR